MLFKIIALCVVGLAVDVWSIKTELLRRSAPHCRDRSFRVSEGA